jgi:hypothetical protein
MNLTAKEFKALQKQGTKMSAESKAKGAADSQAYMCAVCRQTFSKTTKQNALEEHCENKHKKLLKTKPFAEIFPTFKSSVTQ